MHHKISMRVSILKNSNSQKQENNSLKLPSKGDKLKNSHNQNLISRSSKLKTSKIGLKLKEEQAGM